MWQTAKKYLNYSQTIALVGCIAFILWLRYAPPTSPSYTPDAGPVVTAPVPKVVEKIIERLKVVTKPGPERIVFIQKEPLAAKLEMPELLSTADNVLSVATVKPHTGSTTVVSTLSPTGEGRILLRQEPPKFWDLKKEFGVRAGFGSGNLILGEIYVRPLRIGPIDLEIRAYARRTDRDGSDFGGVLLLDYKF